MGSPPVSPATRVWYTVGAQGVLTDCTYEWVNAIVLTLATVIAGVLVWAPPQADSEQGLIRVLAVCWEGEENTSRGVRK